MKNLKDIFESQLELDEMNHFKVGDRIKFVWDDVQRANADKNVTNDSGYIIKLSGNDYIVKSDQNGVELKIANKSAYSYGSTGADGQE